MTTKTTKEMTQRGLRRHRVEAPAETTTLNIRGIDAATARAVRSASQARALTLGQYLYRVSLLHAAMREHADGGDVWARKTLAALGLETVTA